MHRVTANLAALGAMQRDGFRDMPHGRLGGVVGDVVRTRDDTGNGRDVDDRTKPVRAHQRNGVLAAEKNGIDIDGLHLLEHVVVFVFDRAERTDAGIVDQHVQAAHRIMRRLQHFLPLRLIGHVMLPGKGRACAMFVIDRGGDSFGPCPVHIRDGHLGAFASHHASRCLAQPLRTAGDKCLLALYATHACLLHCFRFSYP